MTASVTTRRRRSLRVRITGGALVVVVAVLCVAGLLLTRAVEHELLDQIDSSLSANADFVGGAIRNGERLPTRTGPSDLYVQFIGPDGKVIGASTSARTLPALAPYRQATRDRISTVHRGSVGDLRVLTRRSSISPGAMLVVAHSAAGVAEVRSSLLRVLALTLPALSVLLGVLIWVVVGRALRPVDRMRRAVQSISERDLERTIEPPGTGDELDRLAATLNDLLERLRGAVVRERQLVADASHELRTPIASTRVLLETEPFDRESVMRVRAEALARLGQLQDLVDDLLVQARADEPGVEAPTAPVDVDELVLAQARQLEQTTNLHIDVSKVSGGQVAGRDTDLGRLVQNLASNAARYAATTIAFSVREVDGAVELRVSDDGPGIARADRTRIFERFSTLDDAHVANRGGAGLGLSIVAAIVAAHHGTIHAEPTPGRGATFVVRLPAVVTGAAATAPPVLVRTQS